MTVRINMWSGPRNLSTALMYSWAQRADTTVLDEPLYGHYLRVTGRRHPGDDEVLVAQNPQGDEVIADVLLGEYETPVVFFKQMAKHLVGLDRSFLRGGPNILLTRDPFDMLTSLQVQLPDASLDDTGYVELAEIFDDVIERDETPIVIEAGALLRDPRGVLAQLCEAVGLAFDESMLAWPAGPKPYDGVWARYWYDGVHQSTGWKPYVRKDVQLNDAVRPVLDQAMPLYEKLQPYRIH